MYWSGCQSTGAEMRKYFTATGLANNTNQVMRRDVRLSTCWRATTLSGGRLC
jgi:hypothetical protein